MGMLSMLTMDSDLDLFSAALLLCCCFNSDVSGIGVGARGTSWRWLGALASLPAPTGLMVRNEFEVLAATRRESGTEPNGAMTLYSVLITLALFFCGPSSPSVASSAADVLPVSKGFFLGRPLGLPVGFLLLDLEDGREGRGWGTKSVAEGTAGDGTFSAGFWALCGADAILGVGFAGGTALGGIPLAGGILDGRVGGREKLSLRMSGGLASFIEDSYRLSWAGGTAGDDTGAASTERPSMVLD
jgi:hypothetical protein